MLLQGPGVVLLVLKMPEPNDKENKEWVWWFLSNTPCLQYCGFCRVTLHTIKDELSNTMVDGVVPLLFHAKDKTMQSIAKLGCWIFGVCPLWSLFQTIPYKGWFWRKRLKCLISGFFKVVNRQEGRPQQAPWLTFMFLKGVVSNLLGSWGDMVVLFELPWECWVPRLFLNFVRP